MLFWHTTQQEAEQDLCLMGLSSSENRLKTNRCSWGQEYEKNRAVPGLESGRDGGMWAVFGPSGRQGPPEEMALRIEPNAVGEEPGSRSRRCQGSEVGRCRWGLAAGWLTGGMLAASGFRERQAAGISFPSA